ncbi:protein NOI4-like isoform X2 [Primulina eburnea]|uniref:protein NOI4-like isoform X2 n=1 Tax=Primulina eburnea TaxID=1245227 RepID=UPI003C6C3202
MFFIDGFNNLSLSLIRYISGFHFRSLCWEIFASRGFMSEKGRPLPKFGEWDVNDPASAEGFTVIFNKARDEKKTGGKPDSPTKLDTNTNTNHGMEHVKTQGKKWFCCMQSSSTNY